MYTYEEFVEVVGKQLRQRLEDNVQTDTRSYKNDQGTWQGELVVTKKGKELLPVINLDVHYRQYRNGRLTMPEIIEDICRIENINFIPGSLGTMQKNDFERVREQLRFVVVNQAANREKLELMPHVRVLDLAMVFYMKQSVSKHGEQLVFVSHEHLRWWNIRLEDLKALAVENTERHFPTKIKPISKAYILTNTRWHHGAGCFLYHGLLKTFAETVGRDLLILPSSVHETLVIPDEGLLDFHSLDYMIKTINRIESAAENILSGLVYQYVRAEERLGIFRGCE